MTGGGPIDWANQQQAERELRPCDCGHTGMHSSWHPKDCPVREQQAARHTVDTITSDARRASMRNLLDRADRGALTASESTLLRQQIHEELSLAAQARNDLQDVREHLRYVLDYKGPGHCHLVPGRWDADGRPCDHCARLAAARAALDEPKGPRP